MRQAGILMAVSSLPSRFGIGDFGPTSYEFLRLVKKSGAKIWQILPLNPLGYGNSPYQPYSSKALDEVYLSLELLAKEHLLPKRIRSYHPRGSRVDYDGVRAFKTPYLKKAYARYIQGSTRAFDRWKKANPWVFNYAVFLTLKKENRLDLWTRWPAEHKHWILDKKLDLTPFNDRIEYEMWIQFMLAKQWHALHSYAKKLGIAIMGDIPIYVGIDSDDVWCNQENFLLDDQGNPTFIAGVPPDYFSATGQRWGNPIYDWDYMIKDGFKFWLDRLAYSAQAFDLIRIDHFRAFDTYWKIPASCPTAVEGAWIEAPGYQFFDTIFKALPGIQIVAEDLGDLRPQVLQLRDHYHFKGMKIVEFTLDSEAKMAQYHPHQDRTNMIVYTGTHDNQTLRGWFLNLSAENKQQVRKFLAKFGYHTYGDIVDQILAYTLNGQADYAIIPVQDILGLSDQARMNTPGTIGTPNWEWKLANYTLLKKRLNPYKAMVIQSQRGEH